MPAPRTGILLVNLGTPDSPEIRDVRRYLREFLSDPRVLDTSALARAALLNFVILPFRPKASAAAYRKIWTDRGSPLLVHGRDLQSKVQAALGPDVPVELGMRYQNPAIGVALERLRARGVERIIVLPLFPQYSSAAWGSAMEEVFRRAAPLWNVPALSVVPPFYDAPGFLDAFAAVARPVLDECRADRVIFSFHGLPERQLRKSDEAGGARCAPERADCACCAAITSENRWCYRAQCFATARGIAGRLALAPERTEVTFQSRLGRDPWIRPFTDVRIQELAASGTKRLAVLSPAFVADCLETLEELAIRGREDFIAHGGEELRLVPSLNATDRWVDAVLDLLQGVATDLKPNRTRSV